MCLQLNHFNLQLNVSVKLPFTVDTWTVCFYNQTTVYSTFKGL